MLGEWGPHIFTWQMLHNSERQIDPDPKASAWQTGRAQWKDEAACYNYIVFR